MPSCYFTENVVETITWTIERKLLILCSHLILLILIGLFIRRMMPVRRLTKKQFQERLEVLPDYKNMPKELVSKF